MPVDVYPVKLSIYTPPLISASLKAFVVPCRPALAYWKIYSHALRYYYLYEKNTE